jgi:hypothetical protein
MIVVVGITCCSTYNLMVSATFSRFGIGICSDGSPSMDSESEVSVSQMKAGVGPKLVGNNADVHPWMTGGC